MLPSDLHSGGIEAGGHQPGEKFGNFDGLQLCGVAQLLDQWTHGPGIGMDALDFDATHFLGLSRGRLDRSLVEVDLGQRQVRVRLEQLLALAACSDMKQGCQRTGSNQLADAPADAVVARQDFVEPGAAHAFGYLGAARDAPCPRCRDFSVTSVSPMPVSSASRASRTRSAKPARKIIQSGES